MDPQQIPYHALNGAHGSDENKPLLHFAHANGYPPMCYRQLLEPLLDYYRVIAIEHRPLWSGAKQEDLKSWHTIADDLIAFLDLQGAKKIVGIGHSLGAIATLMAAVKRPTLFSHLVLIEPVLLPERMLFWLGLMPLWLRMRIIPMVPMALKRKDRWENKEAVFHSYRTKRVFARLSDEALWDFIDYGIRPVQNGVRRREATSGEEAMQGEVELVYPKAWEAHIYATIPQIWQPVRKLTQPTLGIRGEESNTILPRSWQKWKQLQPRATFVQVQKTGHLVPLEEPTLLAETILEWLLDQNREAT
ncbi:alpha/beta hydrolase [Chloroflexi bacterium TSY]|nr:alpha/beta hydrolase [Chloroflexi bacterium TSY]